MQFDFKLIFKRGRSTPSFPSYVLPYPYPFKKVMSENWSRVSVYMHVGVPHERISNKKNKTNIQSKKVKNDMTNIRTVDACTYLRGGRGVKFILIYFITLRIFKPDKKLPWTIFICFLLSPFVSSVQWSLKPPFKSVNR